MTTTVLVRRGGIPDALAAAAALALAAVMTLLVPLLGAVRAADGGPVWFATGALWVTLLPALVPAALAAVRPVAALAVAAGAGLMGLFRLLADLPVVTDPDSAARPDLFVETTDRALPFAASGGGYLLLAADAVTLAAGVFAALRLAPRLSFQQDPDPADGDPLQGPEALDAHDRVGPPVRRNYLMVAAGFLGVLLLAVGALGVPFQGGYLASRYVPAAVTVSGLIGAMVLAVIAAIAVLVGGILSRGLAVALLGGAALGACVPFLSAVVAVATAPTALTGSVWFGLAGGVLLAAAGLLTRVRPVRTAERDSDVAPPSPVTALLAGIAALAAAALCVAAFLLPPLDAGGFEDLLVLSDGSPVPGPTLFGAAAIPLALAGAVCLVPRLARAGRAAVMVVWAGAALAVTEVLDVLGDDGLSTARMLHLVGVGPGTWCGVAALGLAGVAAVLAAVTSRRAAEAGSTVPDDDSVASVRSVTVPIAAGLAALALAAAFLPSYGTSGQIQAPTVLRGYAVGAWGVWAVLIVTVVAVGLAAMSRDRTVTVALCVAAAAVQAVRMVVPDRVSDAAGFGLRGGFVVQALLVLALLAAAVAFGLLVGRIRDADRFDQPLRRTGRAAAGRRR
jgi:hypothetical protein